MWWKVITKGIHSSTTLSIHIVKERTELIGENLCMGAKNYTKSLYKERVKNTGIVITKPKAQNTHENKCWQDFAMNSCKLY